MIRLKKILFIPNNYSWGGSEWLWFRSAIILYNQGYSVSIIIRPTLVLPYGYLDSFNDGKFEIYTRPTVSNKFIIRVLIHMGFNSLSFSRRLSKMVSKIAPDLIVYNQGFNFEGLGAYKHLKHLEIPFITISHALNESCWPSDDRRNAMRTFFKHSQHNYFVSFSNLVRTANQLSEHPGHCSVVKNPFNVTLNNSSLVYPDARNIYYLAFVGRYDFSAKGQDLIIDVLCQDKWKNRNLFVNFYGDGPDKEALNELLKFRLIINAQVNELTSPDVIWAKNHALILTSRYEGLPIVIVEAMLSKRIAIVTDVSGNAELIQDGITGFVSDGTSPRVIDAALEKAWSRRGEWEQMGIAAYESIKDDYSVSPEDVFAEKIISHI